MKNKKIVLLSTLILAIALLCTILIGCDTTKLQKTGGTTDGSPITADTDPDIIVSQKVSEEQWNDAMEAYANLQKGFSLNDIDEMRPYDSVSMLMTVRYNKDLFGDDMPDSIVVAKSTRTTCYFSMDNSISYGEYAPESGKYYIYTPIASGIFTKREIPASHIAQTQTALNQMAIDNDFKSFKYDKDANAYVGAIKYDALIKLLGATVPDGMSGKITIKLVDGVPVYLKQEIIYEEQSIMVGEALYFDFNTTVIALPQVD